MQEYINMSKYRKLIVHTYVMHIQSANIIASYICSVIHNYAESNVEINAIIYANANYAHYESMHMFIRP